jgi:cell division protein YceG involved in septum cleavage
MSVSNNSKIIEISIKSTNINEVTELLYKKNLIKNRIVFKIYVDIYEIKFKKGIYKLSKSMDVKEITHVLSGKEEY